MLRWVILAAIPSGLMLSTTTHLTTDIVAIPLLWVLPLGLYLLSFVDRLRRAPRHRQFLTSSRRLIHPDRAAGSPSATGSNNPLFSAPLGLILLFVVAVALHAELFRLRPAASHLTRFYLAMSVGGMIGGFFCAIMAPLLFDWAYEHPILILAAAWLVPQYELVPWLPRCGGPSPGRCRAFAFILSFVDQRRPARAAVRRRQYRRWRSARSWSRCSPWPASAGAGRSSPASPP